MHAEGCSTPERTLIVKDNFNVSSFKEIEALSTVCGFGLSTLAFSFIGSFRVTLSKRLEMVPLTDFSISEMGRAVSFLFPRLFHTYSHPIKQVSFQKKVQMPDLILFRHFHFLLIIPYFYKDIIDWFLHRHSATSFHLCHGTDEPS